MTDHWAFRNNKDEMWQTSAHEPEICYEKRWVLPCPFCEGEPAPLDENDHTSCTNITCGSTAYMHVDAWNNRPAMKAYARIEELEAELAGWDADMDAAPKGKTVTVKSLVSNKDSASGKSLVSNKDSASGKSLKSFEEFEPDHVILMSECGKVIKSYWLPEENRWAGFSEKSRPLAWQAWPEWSERIAADVRAARALEAAA